MYELCDYVYCIGPYTTVSYKIMGVILHDKYHHFKYSLFSFGVNVQVGYK